MEMSSGRLNALKVALGASILLGLFWGIGNLFFTEAMHEATAPAGEPFTNSLELLGKLAGAFALTWAVAAGIAFRDVLGNLGLLRAITIALGILAAEELYANLVVAESTDPLIWGTNGLLIILFVVLLVLSPRDGGTS